jgi:hypothetical protein
VADVFEVESFNAIGMDRGDPEAGIEFEQERFGTIDARLDEEIAIAGFERDFS